jgi:hypothetical protein
VELSDEVRTPGNHKAISGGSFILLFYNIVI